MKEDEFGSAMDRTFAFTGALIGGVNVASGLIFVLKAKGILSEEEVSFIFDEAMGSCAKIDLPDPWGHMIETVLTQARDRLA